MHVSILGLLYCGIPRYLGPVLLNIGCLTAVVGASLESGVPSSALVGLVVFLQVLLFLSTSD